MRSGSLLLAALGAAFMLGAAAPAFAQRDDWHGNAEHGHYVRQDQDHREWGRRDRDQHDWDRQDLDRQDWDRREAGRQDWDRHDADRRDWDHRGDWDQGYAPPVFVAPPEGYYAPPPVAYSPGVTFGFTLR